MGKRLTDQEREARQYTERVLRANVVEMARSRGWRIHGVEDSAKARTIGQDGWPDLFMVRGEHVMVVELKQQTEHPTEDQQAWHDALARIGITVHIWRPLDWLDGTIDHWLRGL